MFGRFQSEIISDVQGRRKTADTETGIAVGGVSKAVAERKLAKKPVCLYFLLLLTYF